MSKRTGDVGVAKIRKRRKTNGMHQPLGQGDRGGQHLDPGGIRY